MNSVLHVTHIRTYEYVYGDHTHTNTHPEMTETRYGNSIFTSEHVRADVELKKLLSHLFSPARSCALVRVHDCGRHVSEWKVLLPQGLRSQYS